MRLRGGISSCAGSCATGGRRWARGRGTPLHSAIQKGRVELCRLLCEKGADINAAGGAGWTPLHTAAISGAPGICEFLCEKGALINARDEAGMRPIDRAAWLKKDEMVSLLWRLGGEFSDNTLNFEYAAKNEDIEKIKKYIAGGADVNTMVYVGKTLLHWAALMDRREMVKLLVECGADMNSRAEDGETPLHFAAGEGNMEVIKLLLKAGADVIQPVITR